MVNTNALIKGAAENIQKACTLTQSFLGELFTGEGGPGESQTDGTNPAAVMQSHFSSIGFPLFLPTSNSGDCRKPRRRRQQREPQLYNFEFTSNVSGQDPRIEVRMDSSSWDSSSTNISASPFAAATLGIGSVTTSQLSSSSSQSANPITLIAELPVTSDEDFPDVAVISRPSFRQLVEHPVAVISLVPKGTAMFVAGAVSGALAKSLTAPLDRVKLMMQVRGVQAAEGSSFNLVDAVVKIGKEEGVFGYWKGNLPQVLRVIPYSAVQLIAYDMYKKLFQGSDKELSVSGRLAAGACAGMTSTFVTYPLDVLRLRLAVDPLCNSMSQVAVNMLREEGPGAFYRGLGPSLLGIAPYIALNFCAFDLIKKALPEDVRKSSMASFLPAFLAAALATVSCYPLDTVRRQMQMKGTPYATVLEAIPGVIAKEGVGGLYRGFLANALKNLPNSSIRLGTYDMAKSLISRSKVEFDHLVEEGKAESRRRGVGRPASLPSRIGKSAEEEEQGKQVPNSLYKASLPGSSS